MSGCFSHIAVALDYNAGLTGGAAGLAHFLANGNLTSCGAGESLLKVSQNSNTNSTAASMLHPGVSSSSLAVCMCMCAFVHVQLIVNNATYQRS
jgi:hypothetical protein